MCWRKYGFSMKQLWDKGGERARKVWGKGEFASNLERIVSVFSVLRWRGKNILSVFEKKVVFLQYQNKVKDYGNSQSRRVPREGGQR